jgi:hypothetical protein
LGAYCPDKLYSYMPHYQIKLHGRDTAGNSGDKGYYEPTARHEYSKSV